LPVSKKRSLNDSETSQLNRVWISQKIFNIISKGSCTLAKFVCENISDDIVVQFHLPALPWAIEMFLSVSWCPRWPRQVQQGLSYVAVAGVIALKRKSYDRCHHRHQVE
jgi:hypothetical protein